MVSGAFFNRKNPKAVDEVHHRLKLLSKKVIVVGFPKGKSQAYPDGTSVIDVAASHVYGVGVPERDFMSLAAEGIERETKPFLRAIVKSEDISEVRALQTAAGLVAETEIKNAIVELDEPPNSSATIAAKGSDNPLIDTTHMLRSVTHVIRDKERS